MAREFNDSDELKVSFDEGEESPILKYKDKILEKNTTYYFTIPNKGEIYIFNSQENEHHSNFKRDKINNPKHQIVAAGFFTTDDNSKLSKIVNASGHYKPDSNDCTEALLRKLSKKISNINPKIGVESLLSKSKRTENGDYMISVDITKCGGNLNRGEITSNSIEPIEAISAISSRKIKLINENGRKSLSKVID